MGGAHARAVRSVTPRGISAAAFFGLPADLAEVSAILARRPRRRSPPRPLVLGAIAAHAGMDAESLVRLTVYDDMACAVAALLKLEPGDPAHGVAIVLEACSSIERTRRRSVEHSPQPDAIPAAGAPQAEAWSEAHALTNRRLFRA